VSVRGKTVELGEAAVLKSVRTPSIVPDVGSHLNIVQNCTTNTTFQVKFPAADPFLTTDRWVVILQKGELKHSNFQAGMN
jgi:hypothetical protein